jgi:hypothetical protein
MCAALAIACTLNASCVSGPDPRAAASAAPIAAAPVSIDDQIAQLEKASQPGASHKELLALCGDWNVRLVDVSPDGRETDVAAGSATIRSEFGARYLRWETSMRFGGRDHATTGFVGFDLGTHEYQSLMLNDVGTGMSVAYGNGQLKRSGIRFTLDLIDRESGGRARMSSVLRSIDADHFVQDLLGGELGGERVVRRYHYVRANAPAVNPAVKK